MKKRKMMGFALALVVLWGMMIPAQAAGRNYPDTEGHYAAKVVDAWSEYGVLQGYEDGTFRPDGTITRAEMAAVLNRVMGYRKAAENTFADLPADRWYTDGLLRLAEQGVFQGYDDGRMNPESPITREEAFATLARSLGLEESGKTPGFVDDSTISGWARGYVSAMKEAGYIQGDQHGTIRAKDPITRAETVTILNKMVAAFVNTDGAYSQDCKGNLFINAQDVTLKDMTIDGDLIVTEGVGEGDVYLDNVKVKGDVILHGCGENSFHILPGTEVGTIIVTKTTGGMIRLVNESGQTIPMIYINDGVPGVILDGDALGEVIIACDAPVTIAATKVDTVSVVGGAKVTVEKGTTVSELLVGKTAEDAELTVKGRVSELTNDAKITVNKQGGTVGSSSGSSSGGGSSGSSGGSSGSGGSSSTKPTEIAEVTLQLLAPTFGSIPDTADVMGTGYTAVTRWFNADGSAPSYRWKSSSTESDTFTADQAYQAVVTLSPMSNRVFADEVKVTVTDGNGTNYTPASSAKSGNNWVVTMQYEATEHREYVEFAEQEKTIEVVSGKEGTVRASMEDNKLADPASYGYQWYKCEANGSNASAVSGATKVTYPLSGSDTRYTGSYYYFLKVTVGGKEYQSAVIEVKILPSIQKEDVPKPTAGEIRISDNLRELQFDLNNLIEHSDVDYTYSLALTYKYTRRGGDTGSSTTRTGGWINDVKDGHAVGSIPLPLQAEQLLEYEMKFGDNPISMIELVNIEWTVETRILIGNTRTPIDGYNLAMEYDFTNDKLQYIFVGAEEATPPEMEEKMADRVTEGVQLLVGDPSYGYWPEAKVIYRVDGAEQKFPETYECLKLGNTGTMYGGGMDGQMDFLLSDLRWDGAHWVMDYFYMPEFEDTVDEQWDVWVYGFAVHKNEEDGYNRVYIYEIHPEIVIDQNNS